MRRTTALNGMRSQLLMESSRWSNTSRRLQMLNTLSLTLITQAAETFLIQNSRPDYIPPQYRLLIEKEVTSVSDVHKRMKLMRRVIGVSSKSVPFTRQLGRRSNRISAADQWRQSNSRITTLEESILQREVVIRRVQRRRIMR